MKGRNIEEPIFYSPRRIVKMILNGGMIAEDNIYNVVSNKKRQEIIKFCYKKPRTITEIQKHLNLSYNPAWKHVKKLIDKCLVESEKKKTKTGLGVFIKTINPNKT